MHMDLTLQVLDFGDPGDHYLINGLIAAAYNMVSIISPTVPSLDFTLTYYVRARSLVYPLSPGSPTVLVAAGPSSLAL